MDGEVNPLGYNFSTLYNWNYQILVSDLNPVRSEHEYLTFILTNLQAITGDECYRHGCQFHVYFMRRRQYERHGGHVRIPVFWIAILFVAIYAYALTMHVMSTMC